MTVPLTLTCMVILINMYRIKFDELVFLILSNTYFFFNL